MKRFALFLLIALILTCAASGQTGSSSQSVDKKVVVTGTVYDINQAVIPFSEVVARSFAGKDYQATTSVGGIYKFELPPDVYKIEVNAPGFCPKRVEQFRVVNSSRNQRPLDFVLDVRRATGLVNRGR
jgi:hypothetical protein